MDEKLARVIADMLRPEISDSVRDTVAEALKEMIFSAPPGLSVYTVEEAAKALRTSRDQILAYIRTGQLKVFKLERDSRRNLIEAADLHDLVRRLKEAG